VAGDREPDAARLDTRHPTQHGKHILASDTRTGQGARNGFGWSPIVTF
jgi:hypothetical protein